MLGDGLQSSGGKAGSGVITHLPSLKAAGCWQSAPSTQLPESRAWAWAVWGLSVLQPVMTLVEYARGSWECCTELLMGGPANTRGSVDEGALTWNSQIYSGKVILGGTPIAGAKMNQGGTGPHLLPRCPATCHMKCVP